MAELQWIARIIEENPKPVFSVTVGTMGFALKYLVFDPYSGCGFLMNSVRLTFTVSVAIILPLWMSTTDFQNFMNWTLEWGLKAVALFSAGVTAYSLLKKARRTTRRKRITKARKDNAN